MQADLAPLTKGGVSELHALSRAIGVNTQSYTFDPKDNRTVENFTLQHLAEGHPIYIGQSMASAIESANPSIFRVMPVARADGIVFRHQYFEVVKELAVETPEQAPPNYIEVRENESEATLTRHALGVTATVQELRTAKGQFFFMGKLIYLAVAFVEQFELHALRALTQNPSAYAHYVASRNVWDIDLARAGRARDEYWDIVRRHDNGFFVLRDLVVQDFSDKGLSLTHVLMRSGTRSLIANSSLRTEFYRSGNGSLARAQELGDSIGEVIGGLEIIVVRAYEYAEKDLRIDPLDRHTIIGAHYRMAPNFHPQCDMERWCSAYMEIEIYSVEEDEWQRISLQTAIEASGRFGPEGRLHIWHEELIDGWDAYVSENRRTVPVFDGQYDMFFYVSANAQGVRAVNKVAVFGHMEEWALTHETHFRTANGIAAYIRRLLDKEDIDAIRRGLADIRELYELPITETDLAFISASTEAGRFGVPQLPTANIDANLTGYKPRGYGSIAGYFELASASRDPRLAYVDRELSQRAARFQDAALKLHQAFQALFDRDTHLALNPMFAPEGLRAGSNTKNSDNINSALNFLQNILDQNKATLYFDSSAAAVPGGRPLRTAFGTNQPPEIDPFDEDAPEEYREVQDLLGDISVPSLLRVFGSADALAAFERRFATSSFGRKYAAYLTRTRGPVSADGDGADDAAVAAADESVFLKFVRNEAVSRGTPVEKLSVLKRAVDYVMSNNTTGTSPRGDFTSATLRSLGDRVVLQEGETEPELPTGTARQTGLVASVDAIRFSDPTVRQRVRITSPLTPGQVLTANDLTDENLEQLDATGNNTNLSRLMVFTSARIQPGIRADQSAPSDNIRKGRFDGNTVPAFAYSAFVDKIGAEPVINEQLAKRYAFYGNLPDWLLRVSGQMFLLAPVIRQSFEAMAIHDIPLPVSFLLEQFNRRYITSSIIFISQNPAQPVGNVYMLDPDCHVGRDAITKKIMYHFSMYIGAMIHDPRRYFEARDVQVIGYEGGENGQPIDQDTFNLNALTQMRIGDPSLLVFMQPAHVLVGGTLDSKVKATHDIRGYSNRVGNVRSAVFGQERPHHPSALFYTTKLGLDGMKLMTRELCFEFHHDPSVLNSVTHQGTQRIYNPATGNYELFLHSHEPFGTSTGPGSRDLRVSNMPQHYPPSDRAKWIIAG